MNGFVVEPDNPEGLAFAMGLLARDETLWAEMCRASRRLAPTAGIDRFGTAVEQALGIDLGAGPAAPALG